MMDFSAVEALLSRGQVCHLGFSVPGQTPYVVPVNYGYADNALYFHGATQGRKAELLRAEPEVSVTITVDYDLVMAEAACGWTSHYTSVLATGRVSVAKTPDEQRQWLRLFMNHYMAHYVAHYTRPPEDGFLFPDKMLEATLVARVQLSDISAKTNPAPEQG